MTQSLRIETPRAFVPFLYPSRYKAAHGGRGGGKSHLFAELLVERCIQQSTRAVCIREVQLSLKESVRQLIVDKIAKFGAQRDFEVLESEIRCPHGGLIIFRGMQSYNAESIKSLEAYDIAWVEEAQTLSERSLKMLRPTIRKPNSEIWFSWNPRHESDPVDLFFRGASPPKNAVIQRVGWQDNPWFPDVLREEMEHDRAKDSESAAHVWDGGYEIISEGSYFGALIAKAESDGRIGLFPYDPSIAVKTAWDIGIDDYTAIWFLQENRSQVRVIDYYEASGIGAEQIVTEAMPELLRNADKRTDALRALTRKQYNFAEHYLPHDAKVREWGGGAKERVQALAEIGIPLGKMRVGVAANPADRIEAVRRLLPFVQFDRGPMPGVGVNLGLSRLRKYSRRFNESLGVFVGPKHDENSHGCDAFGEFAINCHLSKPTKTEVPRPSPLDDYIEIDPDNDDDEWKSL